MNQLALLLRALWWRRGLSAATLVVAAITIGAGSLGPLYARAADESTLRDRLNGSQIAAALHFTFARDIATDGDLEQAASLGPKPGSITGYPTTIVATAASIEADTPAQAKSQDSGPLSRLIWRDGACAHLVFTQGHCPTKPGEAVVSARTLDGDYYGWKLGTTLKLFGIVAPSSDIDGAADAGPPPISTTVKIVGTYRLQSADDPFWQGRTYFDAHPGTGDGPDTVDGVFVDRSELATITPTNLEVQVDYPVDADQVRLGDVARLRSQVAALSALRPESQTGDSFTTGVLGVLTAARAEQKLVDLSTLLVSIELAVLAWLVLFQVIADAVEAKGSEIALAKLRGLGAGATVRFGLAEPLLLVALATPIGLVGGWLSVRLLASSVLVADTPVAITRGTFVAVAISLAGSLVAAAAAGRRTLRRSVLEQWRRTPGHHPSRLMLVADLVLAAAAIAGLVVLRRTSSEQNPHAVTLLAPALFVFAVALLGIRLLPVILRPLLPATRATQRIGLFLAARQVVRRPAGLRLAALLAVAVGLATFAIAAEGVATNNRAARARVEVGAPVIASVQFESAHDPVQATHQADPEGKWAMATASWVPDGGASVTGSVLAVDTSRFAAVTYSGDTSLSARQTASALVPTTVPPPLQFKATSVRVSVTASALTGSAAPDVLINVQRPGKPVTVVNAGRLDAGAHVYAATVPCATGCTFTGVTWDRPVDTFDQLTGTAVLGGIDTRATGAWAPLAAGLSTPGAWREATQAGNSADRLTLSAAGLTDRWSSEAGGSAGIAHSDSPRPLLVVASPGGVATGSSAPNPLQMVDDSANTADFRIAESAPVLPSVLDKGALVDLTALRTQLGSFDAEATWSVWIGPDAPPDAVARLRAAGLTLNVSATESQRSTELGRQGPALALKLLVICAIVGSILAVGGTAIAIASTGRRRSFELASLRAIGIKRRVLFRASVIEQLFLLGAAMVLGVPAGYLAARLSMPAIPEFADRTPVALHYAPALTGVVLFAVAFAVLLVATSALAARALMQAASPSRLREAE